MEMRRTIYIAAVPNK